MRLLSSIRDYYTNPLKYAKMEELFIQYGEARIPLRSFHEVFALDELGSGHFSHVYSLTKNWVVKIDCNNGDRHYEAYADYAMQNQHNPWVPRIRAKIKAGKCNIYVMERLFPVPPPESTSWLRRKDPLIDPLAQCIGGCADHDDPMFLELIEGFGPDNFNDFCSRNCMMRENGQIVVTDPCSDFEGLGAGTEQWLVAMHKLRNHDSHVRVREHHLSVEQRKNERNANIREDADMVIVRDQIMAPIRMAAIELFAAPPKAKEFVA